LTLDFSPFSFGLRLNRKAHDTIIKVKQYIEEEYQWVVDIDAVRQLDIFPIGSKIIILSSFFKAI